MRKFIIIEFYTFTKGNRDNGKTFIINLDQINFIEFCRCEEGVEDYTIIIDTPEFTFDGLSEDMGFSDFLLDNHVFYTISMTGILFRK